MHREDRDAYKALCERMAMALNEALETIRDNLSPNYIADEWIELLAEFGALNGKEK